MSGRFLPPVSGASVPVRFPEMAQATLDNGLALRVIPVNAVPAITASLIILRGTGEDPADRHGLASLTGDLIDEGAGSRDAIALAEAFAHAGAQFDVDVGPDTTWLSVSALASSLDAVLDLLADIAIRPRLEEADFARVHELRMNRLRQLSQSPGAMADRAYISALFGGHPYGHGGTGTTASLSAITVDDARGFWARHYGPVASTLIVGGDVTVDAVQRSASRVFGHWTSPEWQASALDRPVTTPDARILLVNRPDAPQSELRVGHVGPSRRTDSYHALVTVNALLGGQFTSRINRKLREEKGVTYGARTSFDFRRVAGTFSCETSVQGDATAVAVADVLAELEDVRKPEAVDADELFRAKASLTRGYVRNFETAGQLVRAAGQLVTYGLDDNTFDRFVSSIDGLSPADIHGAASRFLRPDQATVVVVGDAAKTQASLETLGRPLAIVAPEF